MSVHIVSAAQEIHSSRITCQSNLGFHPHSQEVIQMNELCFKKQPRLAFTFLIAGYSNIKRSDFIRIEYTAGAYEMKVKGIQKHSDIPYYFSSSLTRKIHRELCTSISSSNYSLSPQEEFYSLIQLLSHFQSPTVFQQPVLWSTLPLAIYCPYTTLRQLYSGRSYFS